MAAYSLTLVGLLDLRDKLGFWVGGVGVVVPEPPKMWKDFLAPELALVRSGMVGKLDEGR